MSFRDDLYTQDIQPRVDTIEKRPGQRWITENEAESLTHRLNMEEMLGIFVESDGELRNYVKEVPRLFIMKKGEDGSDLMMDLKEAGIERGSREFWQQVQCGNVFAYPAGDKEPVQLQVDASTNQPQIRFSKPVTAETFPPAPEPRRPGIFARIGQIFSSRLRQRCVTYDNWIADQRINFNKIRSNAHLREVKKTLNTEKNEISNYFARRQERIRTEKNRAIRDELDRKANKGLSKEEGRMNAVTMFQPVPVTRPNLLSDTKEARFYSQEQFDKLEAYPDLKLSDIKIGGKGLENDDFAAIAMAASIKPAYAVNNPLMLAGGGGIYVDVYKNVVGISEEDAQSLCASSFDGSLSRDLMEMGGSRGLNGAAIESMAVPGRRDAKEALQKYNPNDPESKKDLAEILAHGIKRAAQTISTQTGEQQERVHNYFHMAGKLTEYLDRDPDLMRLAQEAGMDQKHYKAVKGMAELDRLDTKRTDAKRTLYTAAVGNRVLDENVKKQALRDILKANLAESTIVNEAENTQDDPRVMEAYVKLKEREYTAPSRKDFQNREDYNKAREEYNRNMNELRTNPKPFAPGGKLWPGTPEKLAFGMREMYNPAPKTALSLASEKGSAQLDAMVDEIIEKDKLMTLGTAELGEKLQQKDYFGIDLLQKGKLAADAIKAKENAPAKEENVDLNLNKEENKEKEQQAVQFKLNA